MTLTIDMDSIQILKVLKGDSFTETVFQEVLPSDRLPKQIVKRPKGFIVNVDPSNKPGSHWVAIYLTEDGKGEFFDSYGQRPDVYSQSFKTFLKKFSIRFTWNDRILQSIRSRVCGQYCLFYALHRCRNIPMSSIVNMFSKNRDWNDNLVHDFMRKWYNV